MANIDVINLHVRRLTDGGSLPVDDVLRIVRRVLNEKGYVEEPDSAADHDFLVFLFPRSRAGWVHLQSPSQGWREMIGSVAREAEQELDAETVMTEVSGEHLVDVIPYRNGKPANLKLGLSAAQDPEAAMNLFGLAILTELEDGSSGPHMVIRFRSPGIRPKLRTASMADVGELAIPRLLCGEYSEVKTKWNRIMRKVARAGSWGEVMAELDFVTVESTPGRFVTYGGRWRPPGENVWLCLVIPENLLDLCVAASESSEEGHQRTMGVVNEGLDWFWLCLGVLGAQRVCWLRDRAMSESDNGAWYRDALYKVLRWWSTYCRLRPRFEETPGIGWATWGMLPAHWCSFGGIATKDQVQELWKSSPELAGERMRQWLNRNDSR